jgi:hypothetical protein
MEGGRDAPGGGKEFKGSAVRNKIRFFHIQENDFEWERSIIRDGGKS